MPTTAWSSYIPKTGGTWGTWAMQSAGVEFEKIGDTHHLMKEEVEIGDRFAFAFVRDPFTWYASVWKYHRVNPLYLTGSPSVNGSTWTFPNP